MKTYLSILSFSRDFGGDNTWVIRHEAHRSLFIPLPRCSQCRWHLHRLHWEPTLLVNNKPGKEEREARRKPAARNPGKNGSCCRACTTQRGGVGFQWLLYFIWRDLEVKNIYQCCFSGSQSKEQQSWQMRLSARAAALLLSLQHWKHLTYLMVRPQLKLWDSPLQNHAGILDIQTSCRETHQPLHSSCPCMEMSWKAPAHLCKHSLQTKPPLCTHLEETHEINIEEAVSQLIKLLQRWTAGSLISWSTAPWCSFCKGV